MASLGSFWRWIGHCVRRLTLFVWKDNGSTISTRDWRKTNRICSTKSTTSLISQLRLMIKGEFCLFHSSYLFTVVVAQTSSDNNTVCYILPVLQMTSWFDIMDRHRRREWIMAYTRSNPPWGSTGGKLWCLRLPCRVEAQEKMASMSDRAEKDVHQHNAEMKELIRVIDRDRRLREFMNAKSKEREEDEQLVAWRVRKGLSVPHCCC